MVRRLFITKPPQFVQTYLSNMWKHYLRSINNIEEKWYWYFRDKYGIHAEIISGHVEMRLGNDEPNKNRRVLPITSLSLSSLPRIGRWNGKPTIYPEQLYMNDEI